MSKSYKLLLENYAKKRDNGKRARTEILGISNSLLRSLGGHLKTHEKNEYAWGEIWGVRLVGGMERTIPSGDDYLDRSFVENFKRGKGIQSIPPPTGTARPRVPQAVLSRSTGRPYYPRMDNRRPSISIYSPSSRSSTTRTPYRPQRPKKIVKSIWVKKGSTVESQAVLPQNVSVKRSAMITSKQTWRQNGGYLDSVNRDNGSYILKQFEYGNPEEDLKDYAIIDSGCSGSMTGDKDKLSDFKDYKG
ncbi:hypothetical protein Tco_0431973 [Tanacetum coccineum]